jgi:NitT/TauT family transport system substrate-binding protein
MVSNFKILAAALACLATLVCSATAHAQDKLKIAIGQINNWENQAPTLGQDTGIFKKHNLVLENFGTQGAGETMQPIISASADIGAGVGVAGVMNAFAKGAPVRIIAPMFTGTSDIYWYVRADSPIKSLKDATDRNSIAYSTTGSTSHNIVLAFVSDLGVKAKPTATGGPPGTFTQVMTGQIDIGWGAPPFGLQEERDGKIRIIARGSDATPLAGQTIRVLIVNADVLKTRKDAVVRFVRAYRETAAWMYSSPDAVRLYAEKTKIAPELIRESIAKYHTLDAMQTDAIKDTTASCATR